MANSDVFIDDIRIQDLGIIVRLNSQEPMLPDLRPNTIAVPGRHGAYDFGAFFDAREFLLDCVFKRQDYAELKAQIRQFVRLFVDDYGRPKTVKLRFGDEPDKYYDVKVSAGIPIDRLAGMGSFTLPLVAHDPMAKFIVKSDKITMNSDIPIMSDLLWDTGFSSRTITAPTTFTIANNGTTAIRFSYKVVGSGTNVAVAAHGKSFSLGTFSGKTIEVNGELYTVKVSGVNDLTKTGGDFIELLPGINSVTVSGSNLNITVSESLTYKYL